MTKKQLQVTIEQKDREISLYRDITTKLIHDFVYIKPVPKGRIKQRIVVFIEPVVVNKIEAEVLIFLKNIHVKKVVGE